MHTKRRSDAGRFRGGTETVAELFVAMLERYPNAAVRAGCAYYLSHLGRRREAQRHIDALAADAFASIPNNLRKVALCHLASACASLGDEKRAAALYELLSPCASLATVMVVIEAYCGPVAHYLGVLAAALERWTEAQAHFEQAMAMSRRLHAWPWLAETQCEYARALRARGRAGDEERSDRLAREALATARAIDAPALVLRLQSIREGRAPAQSVVRPRRGAGPVFLERGDHWAASFGGTEVSLKDSKGLRYLATLVRQPRRQIEAAKLAAATATRRPPAGAEASERARSAVTKRIRAEVKKIAALHPALGRHLAATVSTGHVCRYDPEGGPVRRRPHASRGS